MASLQDQHESLSAETKDKELRHNAEINANYQKYFCVNKTPETDYIQAEKSRSLLEKKNSEEFRETFEEVRRRSLERQFLLVESRKNAENTVRSEPVENTENTVRIPSYSAVRDAVQSDIFNSEHYLRAARRKEMGLSGYAEENLEEEVKTAVKEAVRAVEDVKQISVAQETTAATREQWETFAKRAIVLFAAVFVLLMTVIAVNSALINGMDVEYETLQQALQTLREELATMQSSVEYLTSKEAILEFVRANGWILVNP